jgi:3-isopropylmalate dehydrogenase
MSTKKIAVLAASGNIHPGRTSMFEPVHGSAPDMAGRDMANPIGAIASAAMMLAQLGLTQEAATIDAAILSAVQQRKLTRDAGGTLGTRACGEWIASHI